MTTNDFFGIVKAGRKILPPWWMAMMLILLFLCAWDLWHIDLQLTDLLIALKRK